MSRERTGRWMNMDLTQLDQAWITRPCAGRDPGARPGWRGLLDGPGDGRAGRWTGG